MSRVFGVNLDAAGSATGRQRSVRTVSRSAASRALAEGLECPVCLNTFKDPCFVCSRHHTLCRACYQSVAASNDRRCPMCRERLTDRPVDNSEIRAVIDSLSQIQQSTCEASLESGRKCRSPALSLCEHCSRNLCDLHFSEDRMEFQCKCREMLAEAAAVLEEKERKEAELTQWIDWFDQCSSQLRQLQQRIEGLSRIASEMASVASPEALQTARTKLRSAMDVGNVAETKIAFDQLVAVKRDGGEGRTSSRQVATPSKQSKQLMRQFSSQLTNLGDEMEKPFLEAIHGDSGILGPAAVSVPSQLKVFGSPISNWVWPSYLAPQKSD